MKSIQLTFARNEASYRVAVGPGLLTSLQKLLEPTEHTGVFVICDANTEKLWLPRVQEAFPEAEHVTLPAGEGAKRLATIETIWTAMSHAGCDRHSLVIILGGGVVGDLGAFAASTYMRGVRFVQLPTTLVAQCDASLGGKTGFDYLGVKNLIGTFAQPEMVVADTEVLGTLPERQLIAGFAEMIKHGLIRDENYFDALCKQPAETYNTSDLADFVVESIKIKADIVASDETEAGQRKLVNFGHTIGHAVEAASWDTEEPLLHGEAVAIGMVAEAELSHQMEYLSAAAVNRIREGVARVGLPTAMPRLPWEKLLSLMRADKKNAGGSIHFTLLRQIGRASYDEVVSEAVITSVLKGST